VQCLEPAVLAAETALELSAEQRKRTVWRLDGGAGSDEHIRWLLQRDYHIVAKGMSHSRAEALSRRVSRWDVYEQFRGDKSGLGLEARRKRSFLGQKGYILLTDLAHNLLSDFYHRALVGTRFENFGPKRIVRDLLTMPGKLVFEGDRLSRVELLTQKQFAGDLAICLERYCSGG
jgi:hypothetical protein